MNNGLSQSNWTADRSSKTARKYRTQCKFCLLAIYVDQPAVWLLVPLGLSHEECAP
jgi:hypothetical protein